MTTDWVKSSWSGAKVASEPGGPPCSPSVLSGDQVRNRVLRRVVERVISHRELPRGPRLDEVVYETLYAEQARLDRAEQDPRTEADRAFVASLRRQVARVGEDRYPDLVRAIACRYVDEIAGHFDPFVYRMATRVVPPAL